MSSNNTCSLDFGMHPVTADGRGLVSNDHFGLEYDRKRSHSVSDAL